MINPMWRYIFFLYFTKAVSAGFWTSILSPFSEQCDKEWVKEDIIGLATELNTYVFGQEMVADVVLAALQSHLVRVNRKKPLVLNFHGWSGGGKGYVAEFIVKSWFKEGEKSTFLKKYTARLDFPIASKVYDYQVKLQRDLEETVRSCSKAMFIFDEADKYPAHVLDGIKPYLDYSSNVNGLDFREAIFIFITNNGENLITEITLNKWKEGVPREELKLSDFEKPLKIISYNDEGGFYRSDLIRHHLIDVVVPFLPLEREHVKMCIEAEVYLQNGNGIVDLEYVTREIMEVMVFQPKSLQLYSSTGCKRVSEQVATHIQSAKRKYFRSEF